MADAIIEELKHYFSDGSVPPQNILQNIFGDKSAKLSESLTGNIPLDSSLRREAIEEIIKHIHQGDIENAREISKKLGLSSDDFLDLAKIVFDIALNQKNPEIQYTILSGFILDGRRTSTGVVNYLGHLLQTSQFDKALEIRRSFKESIRTNDLEKMGKIFFEEAMNFGAGDEKRDYRPAQKIRDIFKVDKELVKKHALTQYDFNITHGRQEDALEVARLFKLTGDKVTQASITLFEKTFEEFADKLYNGKYRGAIELENNDPYKRALAIVKENKFLSAGPQKADAKTVSQIQNEALSLLVRLNTYAEGVEIEPSAKLFFAFSLISDYHLLMMKDEQSANQCMEIAKTLVDDLEEQMTFVDQAISSYPTLFELYKNASTLQPAIKNIAIKMFSIFMDTNRVNMVTQTLEDFDLTSGDVTPAVKKKFLELLEADKIEDVQKLENAFPSINKLRSDNDFMMKAFHLFEHHISEGDIKKARILQKLLHFAPQRTAVLLKLSLRGLLRKEKYDEAEYLIRAFNINKNHIIDLLIEIYNLELEKGTREAGNFRERFKVSVADVGLIRWLFKEVFSF